MYQFHIKIDIFYTITKSKSQRHISRKEIADAILSKKLKNNRILAQEQKNSDILSKKAKNKTVISVVKKDDEKRHKYFKYSIKKIQTR